MQIELLLKVVADVSDNVPLDHIGAVAQSITLLQYDVTETALPSGVMLKNTNFRHVQISGVRQQIVSVTKAES